MDIGIVIAISAGCFTIVGVMIALFLWTRAEANADRRDIVNLIVAIKEDAANFRREMAQEMKDFHGRLCAIEEKRTK